MAREFSVVVGINASRAIAGGRQFKAGADQVNRSNRGMQRSTAATTRRMTAMITTMGRVRGVASLMFAGFLGVGGISSVVRTITQFSTAMSKVNALLGDRGTTQIMRVLTNKARELGATTAFTATQAAEGMQFLTLAGFDALEVFQAIEPALQLAQAGALGLGQAADIVSNIMAGFAVEASEVIEVVDALAFVSARSNTNIQQLGEAMKFVAPVAGAVGSNVTDTAVALGILGNAGLQASLAGTGLRRVMSGLLNPSKESTAVLAQMGLTSQELVGFLDDEDGLIKVIEALAAKGIDAADAFTLFGQRGAPAVLALVSQKKELRDLTKATREAEGAAAEMAETMIDNLGGDARIAISALQEAILQIGDAGLTEWMRETTQGFAGMIRGMTGMTAGFEGMSASMQEGVRTGEKIRENFENIKKGAILLVAVLGRNALFGAISAVVLNLGKLWAMLRAGVVAFAALRTGALTLTVALRGMAAAFAASPLGIALLVGSLAAYLLTGEDAEETSRRNAEALDAVVKAGNDAALTFDKVASASEKMFKLEQVNDALRAQRQVLQDAQQKVEDYQAAQEGLAAAQDRVAAANRALNEAAQAGEGRSVLARLATEASRARSELQGLEGTISAASFEELNANVEAAWREFQELMKTSSNMQEVLDGNRRFLDASAEAAAKAKAEVEALEANFLSITGVTTDWNQELKKTVEGLLPMVKQIEKAESALEDIRTALGKTDEQLIKMGQSREALTRAEQEAIFVLNKARLAETAREKALRTSAETTEDLADKMHDLKNNTGGTAALTREFTRAIRDSALEVMAGTLTLEEYQKRVALLREEYEDAKGQICDNNKKIRECTDDSAKEMTAIWDQAMRNIQDTFADAFRNIGDGFDDFADGILDAFKDMLAQMAAQAAISNLFGQGGGFFNDFFGGLSGGFTGGGGRSGGGFGGAAGSAVAGAATGGQSGGMLGSLFGAGGMFEGAGTAMQSALSSLGAAATAFGHGAVSFVSGAGGASAVSAGAATPQAVSVFNTGAQNAAIANPGSFTAGGVVAGAGIGALTGAVADAILGGRGDPTRNAIFSAIGGAIGSIWGPIGSVVGGAIGSFVDNLFGGAKKLESAVVELSVSGDRIFAIQEEVVSKQRSFFRGRSFTTTRKNISSQFNSIETEFANFVEVLRSVTEEVGGFTDFIETFEFDRNINVKGANAEANIERAIEQLFQAATDAFLKDVEGLPQRMEITLRSFSDNLDEFVKALELTLAIENLFDIDLVEGASEQIKASTVGIIDSYDASIAAFRDVIATYDGSIESLEALTAATAVFTQVQLDLLAVYEILGRETSALFQGSAQTIREALMSEEELYQTRRDQIDDLVEQASQTTDPEELATLAAEINRLGLDAFNMLDEDQRELLGPEFIEFFEGLDDMFGDQIDMGVGQVLQDQADLDLEVAAKMDEAAQAIIDAARALEREARERALERELRREIHR